MNITFGNLKKKIHVHRTLSVLKETALSVLKLPYANEVKF